MGYFLLVLSLLCLVCTFWAYGVKLGLDKITGYVVSLLALLRCMPSYFLITYFDTRLLLCYCILKLGSPVLLVQS